MLDVVAIAVDRRTLGALAALLRRAVGARAALGALLRRPVAAVVVVGVDTVVLARALALTVTLAIPRAVLPRQLRAAGLGLLLAHVAGQAAHFAHVGLVQIDEHAALVQHGEGRGCGLR